jgi:hypothetical protein
MPNFTHAGYEVTDHGETHKRPNYRWSTEINGQLIRAQSMVQMRRRINEEVIGKPRAIFHLRCLMEGDRAAHERFLDLQAKLRRLGAEL